MEEFIMANQYKVKGRRINRKKNVRAFRLSNSLKVADTPTPIIYRSTPAMSSLKDSWKSIGSKDKENLVLNNSVLSKLKSDFRLDDKESENNYVRDLADELLEEGHASSEEFSIAADEQDVKLDMAVAITNLREDLGYTQREFADKVGMPQPTIAKIETGENNSTLATLGKIARKTNKRLIIGFE